MTRKMFNLLNWFGGKAYLLDKVYPFPQHNVYLEPFGGGGTVLLFKEPAVCEVYNDINDNLTNLITQIQKNTDQFIAKGVLWGALDSHGLFNYFEDQIENNPELSPLERAVMFYYHHILSYGGMGEHFHGIGPIGVKRCHNNYLNKFPFKIRAIADRVRHLIIETQDFRKILKRDVFHEPGSLIYLDPPYFQGGGSYESMIAGSEWKNDWIDELVELVKDTNAYVCISIDKDLDLGPKWNSTQITRLNRAGTRAGRKQTQSTEYVIRNYNINEIEIHSGSNQARIDDYFGQPEDDDDDESVDI